jgi:CheY-like chemotaxis protein
LGDYETRLADLRQQHAADLAHRVDQIAQAVEAGDGAEARVIAHGLSGSAHVLRLGALGVAATTIVDTDPDDIARLRAAMTTLRHELALAVPSPDPVSRLKRLNHDLRSPLTAVLGYAELVLQKDLDSATRGMVDRILEAGGVILQHLDDVTSELDAAAGGGAAVGGRPAAESPAGARGAVIPFSRLDVLIVDNDILVREVVVAILAESWGLSARTASSPREAETALDELRPGLVLIDLQLGAADGAVVVSAARQRCPSALIAVLTGNDPSLRRTELLGLGADIVARKGPPDTLRILVDAALARLAVESLATRDIAG